MDFSKVKSMTIPEGEVALLYIDGKTVWRKVTEQLTAPTISLNGDILTMTATDDKTEEFVIFVDGVEKECVTRMIYFAIDGTQFQAEAGMTWAEWCDSEYNTDGWYKGENGGGIHKVVGNSFYSIYLDNMPVSSNDVITAQMYNYIKEPIAPV